MQFAVTAVLCAAVAAAAPAAVALGPRDDGVYTFTVSNFVAQCETHGSLCTYSFNLLLPSKDPVGTQGPHCYLQLGKAAYGLLPDVTNGGCDLPDRQWTVTRNGDDLVLAAQVPGTASVGSYKIDSRDIPVTSDGAARAQNYVGAQQFNLA